MPPILRWSSFAPLDEEAASQLNFTSEIEYTEKKNLQDEEMPIVESIKRLLKLG